MAESNQLVNERTDPDSDNDLGDEYCSPTSTNQAKQHGSWVVEQDKINLSHHSPLNKNAASGTPVKMASSHKSPTNRRGGANSSSSDNGEIHAKNVVIAALEEKVRNCKCQSSRHSSLSRDSVDGVGRSPVSTPVSPEFTQSSGPVNNAVFPRNIGFTNVPTTVFGNRQTSSDMDTSRSNSTDAEKLATSNAGNLELAKEIEKQEDIIREYTKEIVRLKGEIDRLKDALSKEQRLRQQTLDLKQDADIIIDDHAKAKTALESELEWLRNEVATLNQSLADKDNELEAVRRENLRLHQLTDKETATAFRSTSTDEVLQLNNTVDVLYKELKETVETVKRQSDIIRRRKDRRQRSIEPQQPTFAASLPGPSFRSRSSDQSSPSPPLVLESSAKSPQPRPSYFEEMPRNRRPPIAPSTGASEEDIYGASGYDKGVYLPNRISVNRGGAFDLDSFEESMKARQLQQQDSSNYKALQQSEDVLSGSVNKSPIHRPPSQQQRNSAPLYSQLQPKPPLKYPMRATQPITSHSQPLQPSRPTVSQYPPAASTYPRAAAAREHSDSSMGEGDASAAADQKICPVCNQQQPTGTSFEDFQLHVMDCLGKPDDDERDGRMDSSSDMTCPMCNLLFPPDTPSQEFHAHVNQHFDEETFALVDGPNNTDQFGAPRQY